MDWRTSPIYLADHFGAPIHRYVKRLRDVVRYHSNSQLITSCVHDCHGTGTICGPR